MDIAAAGINRQLSLLHAEKERKDWLDRTAFSTSTSSRQLQDRRFRQMDVEARKDAIADINVVHDDSEAGREVAK